jgi:Tol biopolymer transport system component
MHVTTIQVIPSLVFCGVLALTGCESPPTTSPAAVFAQLSGAATDPCLTMNCDDSNACTTDTCSNAKCQHADNTVACSDGSACTVGDACKNGACKSGTAVTCPAPDSCHTPGTCNTTSGICSNPTKANGTACDDGNTCTTPDACQAGVCTGTEASRIVDLNLGASQASCEPRLSQDGRYVVFESLAPTLVAGDTNGTSDVFLTDRQLGITTRVSVSSSGVEAAGDSHRASLSADGRYIVFDSKAGNLAGIDTNGNYDVFLRDTQTGTTTCISVDGTGAAANSASYEPSVSSDGRYVAFYSMASNLVTGDTNGTWDVFVRDRQNGTTTRVSTGSGGVPANGMSFSPFISADGKAVVFASAASNLVAGDTNGTMDIFHFTRANGTLVRVSVSTAEVQATGDSYRPRLSSTGRYVVFMSTASNLVAGDTNAAYDVFRRDVQSGTTIRASVGAAGAQATGSSQRPSVSSDGRYVAFHSTASNLVNGDTNGAMDVFVFDAQAGTTQRVNVADDGHEGDADSCFGNLSPDGRYVAFQSAASMLVPGDSNGLADIFVAPRSCP